MGSRIAPGEGWREYHDERELPYYHHSEHGTQWTHPLDPDIKQLVKRARAMLTAAMAQLKRAGDVSLSIPSPLASARVAQPTTPGEAEPATPTAAVDLFSPTPSPPLSTHVPSKGLRADAPGSPFTLGAPPAVKEVRAQQKTMDKSEAHTPARLQPTLIGAQTVDASEARARTLETQPRARQPLPPGGATAASPEPESVVGSRGASPAESRRGAERASPATARVGTPEQQRWREIVDVDKELKLVRYLAKGASASVYSATWGGRPCAVKRFHPLGSEASQQEGDEMAELFRNEVRHAHAHAHVLHACAHAARACAPGRGEPASRGAWLSRHLVRSRRPHPVPRGAPCLLTRGRWS